jgi:hypothetical protein
MQGGTKKRMVIGNQDFVCGHFSNDPVFHGMPDAFGYRQNNSR